ncbi:MAG: gamma-glutamyl-phosphate reductase, partial [Gammaproteobacteria bacterium]|nr:gamma-glutamyl-phosphate reductase [Gammaproteobacteria bacterium]
MTFDVKQYMQSVGQQARQAATAMSRAETKIKNAALLAIADEIDAAANRLQEENAKDLEQGRANGLDDALLDRLALNDERIAGMSEG